MKIFTILLFLLSVNAFTQVNRPGVQFTKEVYGASYVAIDLDAECTEEDFQRAEVKTRKDMEDECVFNHSTLLEGQLGKRASKTVVVRYTQDMTPILSHRCSVNWFATCR